MEREIYDLGHAVAIVEVYEDGLPVLMLMEYDQGPTGFYLVWSELQKLNEVLARVETLAAKTIGSGVDGAADPELPSELQ